jgi:hypothetical protein
MVSKSQPFILGFLIVLASYLIIASPVYAQPSVQITSAKLGDNFITDGQQINPSPTRPLNFEYEASETADSFVCKITKIDEALFNDIRVAINLGNPPPQAAGTVISNQVCGSGISGSVEYAQVFDPDFYVFQVTAFSQGAGGQSGMFPFQTSKSQATTLVSNTTGVLSNAVIVQITSAKLGDYNIAEGQLISPSPTLPLNFEYEASESADSFVCKIIKIDEALFNNIRDAIALRTPEPKVAGTIISTQQCGSGISGSVEYAQVFDEGTYVFQLTEVSNGIASKAVFPFEKLNPILD